MNQYDELLHEDDEDLGMVICPECGGTGSQPYKNSCCRRCGGTGEIPG